MALGLRQADRQRVVGTWYFRRLQERKNSYYERRVAIAEASMLRKTRDRTAEGWALAKTSPATAAGKGCPE